MSRKSQSWTGSAGPRMTRRAFAAGAGALGLVAGTAPFSIVRAAAGPLKVGVILPRSGYLFSADSLMALGCGRLFEGTPQQMWDSLRTLRALPAETVVCSGHEYTEGNARFALSIDGANEAL